MGPVYTQEPVLEVGDETFILPFHLNVPGIGTLALQPMVVRAKEPMVVDTGVIWFREQWLKAVSALVEPKDVKWIYISHDDRDHTANLLQLMELCPNARLITNLVGFGRMAEEFVLPPDKMLFVNHGGTFSLGDRTMTCLRPPLFDSPATRGFYDAKSGVFYSVDAFGTFLPGYYQYVEEVPAADYEHGFNYWNRLNHPWHDYVDPNRLHERVNVEILKLNPKTIVSYHGPVIRNRTEEMIKRIMDTVKMGPLKEMTQEDLEAMLAGGPPGAHSR
jgi:flavorubredoxin